MEIERKKNQMKPSTNKKCVSASCHKNIAQWLAQKTNPQLLFFFFFECIINASEKLEKEFTILDLTFKQAKARVFSHSVNYKTTEDDAIDSMRWLTGCPTSSCSRSVEFSELGLQ